MQWNSIKQFRNHYHHHTINLDRRSEEVKMESRKFQISLK